MIFKTLLEMTKNFPKDGRIMGLDVGSKTIGLAVSDSNLKVAAPVGTIQRKKFSKDADRLAAIISERAVFGLLLGLPLSMDGSEGRACQSVRQFAENLDRKIVIGITFWDERLSTAAVERVLIKEADLTRKHRSRIIDELAAVYILQNALDSLVN